MTEPDTFGTYLREIGRFPLLDSAEEQHCALRAARGDQDARQALVQANLRFVVYLARRYRGRGASLQELVSAGNTGLIQAAGRFDPRRNCRFLTYASCWIHHAIREAISEGTRWDGSAPSQDTHGSGEVVPAAARPLSLDATDSGGEGALLERIADTKILSPEHEAVQRNTRETVRGALGQLPRRQATLLELRYGLNGAQAHGTDALARRFGVTTTRILQLERRAIERLRHVADRYLRVVVA